MDQDKMGGTKVNEIEKHLWTIVIDKKRLSNWDYSHH